MQIQLNTENSVMWFLGEPKKILVSLNYVEPGPVEIEFSSLGDNEKKQVLIALRDNVIISDASYDTLYQEWLKSRPTVEEVTPDPQQQFRVAMARKIEERVEKRKRAHAEKEQKFQERCVYLVAQSVKALRATITQETDERLLRNVLKIEEQGKQRTMVIRAIHEKLRQIEAKRAAEIEKKTKKQIKANPQSKQTSPFLVVESEMETVTLSPEELIEEVTGTGGE